MLICFTVLFLFIAFKATQGVVALVKSMDKSNKTSQQQNVNSEQFDLGNEEENKKKIEIELYSIKDILKKERVYDLTPKS